VTSESGIKRQRDNVLERIVSGRTKRLELETLLPWNWKAAREAEAVETGDVPVPNDNDLPHRSIGGRTSPPAAKVGPWSSIMRIRDHIPRTKNSVWSPQRFT
jgi:hypothetical protein